MASNSKVPTTGTVPIVKIRVKLDGQVLDGTNGSKYRLGKIIGKGSFGEIRIAVNVENETDQVAVKLERKSQKTSTLKDELRYYGIIGAKHGIAIAHGLSQVLEYRALVLELLGPSLEDMFNRQKRVFSQKTVLQLAIQLLDRMETIHNSEICYRDVKPENFLLGLPNSPNANLVHVVDFGLSKRYIRDSVHLPYKESKSATGTARYMSLNAHAGCEQSRRDDLEAMAHMFIYFAKGKLPWQGLKGKDGKPCKTSKEVMLLIQEVKEKTKVRDLTEGLPNVYGWFLNQTRELGFTDVPEYNYYRTKFIEQGAELGLQLDTAYDWDDGQQDISDSSAKYFKDQPQPLSKFVNTSSNLPE